MRRGFHLAVVVASFVALSSSAIATELPTFEGLTFPTIKGPGDLEEFSWEVSLSEDQELQLVDAKHVVFYDNESGLVVGSITAESAHDASGANVPTSLAISGGNVITLAVHHRAGNPLTGRPFDYPITAGQGSEGGFQTEVIEGPPDEQELREQRERREREEWEAARREGAVSGCVVPHVKGRSLKAAKRRLLNANCKVGNVRKLKGTRIRAAEVVKQSPRPGSVLPSGASVGVTLSD